jgi:hypothetical protein
MSLRALSIITAGLLAVLPLTARAEGYRCSFETGAAHVLEDGTYRARPAGALAFGIAEVNRNAQSATLVTDRGTGALRVVLAFGATHFIEVATEGFLNLTTIYDTEIAAGERAAVHSRHSGIGGEPVVSQMLGRCRVEPAGR